MASERNRRPAAVSRTERLVRSRSRAPIACSSRLIWRDSGGWVMFSRTAARRKFSSSATATNARKW